MKKYYSLLFFVLFGIDFMYSQINFVEQATSYGVGLSCGNTYLGNGISFCDFNNDGWDDITLATEAGQAIRFFENVNGTFVEQSLNITDANYQTKQLNWVDFDNDGDKDLFVTSDTDGNKLFENVGNMVFQDITASTGMNLSNTYTYGASWGDFNNDGYLDVFISNRDIAFVIPNYLYKNNGDGTFQDVSVSSGVTATGSRMSFCSAFFDYNNDGWQDIYVSNDKEYNFNVLYHNNGDGTFTDISASSGTGIGIDAMTVTIGDFNNDSWFDIYVTNDPSGNVLFKNNGDGTFTDIASSSGTLFNSVGWGAVFLDAENDMDLDLYVSGSLDGSVASLLSAAFYENLDNETFSLSQNQGFVNDSGESYSNAIGDLNNDGFPEIVVNNSNDQNMFLWQNQTVSTNNWLKVKLEGTSSNRDGIGAVIEISINGDQQFRYTHCGEGYLAQNSSVEFFGLGANTTIDYVKVNWLSGLEDVLYSVSGNQLLTIVEGSTLSIEEQDKLDVSVYPNPVINKLFFNSVASIYNVEVSNVLGQTVYQERSKQNIDEIDVTKLNAGVYFIKLSNNKQSRSIKIIKK